MTTCRFAFDDGVYILGALAPAERADYERHLPACQSCRHAVAGLAVLPGLLGRLDPERAMAEVHDVQAPASLLPRVLLAAATRRRTERLKRRWYAVAAGVVAASLAAVVGVSVHMADQRARVATPVAMTSMWPPMPGAQLPVTAEVGLVPVEGGTRVEMRCRYTDSDEAHEWTVRLVVYARAGIGMEQIGSWIAVSGREVEVDGVTHLTPAEIGRVELQTEGFRTLLVWRPPG